MRKITGIMLTVIAVMVGSTAAFSHPADDKIPAEIPQWYGEALRLDSSASTDRLQFVDAFPAAAELSEVERYMIAGTESSLLRGPGFRPWHEEILTTCLNVYNRDGRLPAILDPVAVGYDAPLGDTSLSELLKSPITGEYPRLDAVEFSPGNMLVLPLTMQEMHYFADNYGYRSDWFNEDGSIKDSLLGPVFFVKVYGEEQVIWQNLFYIRRAQKPVF